MKKAVGILLALFVLAVTFALLVPDQRDLGPAIESKQDKEAVVSEKEIQAFNHIEYSLLSNGRYLAVLDPGGFEGERHGGALTIFDTLNGAVIERLDSVSGFAPVNLNSGIFIFSARAGSEFRVFSYDLETGLSKDLDVKGGQGGIILFNDALYMSNNPVSANYINQKRGPNYFGPGEDGWAFIDYNSNEVVDLDLGFYFDLNEIYPRIAVPTEEEQEIFRGGNILLLSRGGKFFLVVNQ